jgi:hypothetical protein
VKTKAVKEKSGGKKKLDLSEKKRKMATVDQIISITSNLTTLKHSNQM